VTVTATPTANPTAAAVAVTAFVTTTVQTSGVSPATTGGIAGGITGGFLLLGALVFVYMTRGSRNRSAANGGGGGGGGGGGIPVYQEEPKPRDVRDSQLRYPDFDENLESGRTHNEVELE
jgi:hypothetical protein